MSCGHGKDSGEGECLCTPRCYPVRVERVTVAALLVYFCLGEEKYCLLCAVCL